MSSYHDPKATWLAGRPQETWPETLKRYGKPHHILRWADGLPVVLKQLSQLILLPVYALWVVLVVPSLWIIWWSWRILGKVAFEIWWFCTGWFWKRLGGVKHGSPEWHARELEKKQPPA